MMINDSNNNYRRGVVNGQSGTWVPVDMGGKVPDNISTDPNKPSVGADNGFYYADPYNAPAQGAPYGGYNGQYGAPQPIAANMNNAIPTPSSIVQLPPIVQPIAMVPFASQNQPLVQYDPNVRPDVPETKTPEPVYRRRPYIGLSILAILMTFAALLIGCFIPAGKAALQNIVALVEEGKITAILNGDMTQLVPVIIGALYALSFLFIVIVMIDAIVKLCAQKAIAKFNVLNLLALIFLIAAVVLSMVIVKVDYTFIISGAIMAVLVLILMIASGVGNREEVVVDYVASKQTFIMK